MPGAPAARVLDTAGHGGTVAFGDVTVMIDGQPAAREGDPIICPAVNGTVPHVGGNITMGSQTVSIGGAFAARMGDPTVCGAPGIVGVGCPLIRGPSGGNPSGDDQPLETSRSDNYQSRSGHDNEIGSHDVEQYSYQHVEYSEVDSLGRTTETREDWGYVQVDSLDGDFAGGGGFDASLFRREEVTYNDEGNVDHTRTVSGLNAQSGGRYLVGDDGRRMGVYADLGAQVSVAELTNVEAYRIPLPFGYNIQIDDTFGVSAASLGAFGQAGAYYDREDERQHVMALIDCDLILGAKVGTDISFGRDPSVDDECQATMGKGVTGGIAGMISTGSSTVNIG